jgi:autotransporter-associated beta strand protein
MQGSLKVFRAISLCAFLLCIANRASAQSTNYTWSVASGGSWTNGSNWGSTTSDFPNSDTTRATFSGLAYASATTVTLDAAITLRRLNFNGSQTGSVTIAPGTGGTLTFDNPETGQPSLSVNAGSGNHTIDANMTIQGPRTHRFTISADRIFTVNGNIGGNQGLFSPGSGTLLLNGTNTYTGPTLIAAGTLGGSGTLASSVTVGGTAAAGATLSAGISPSAPTLTLQNGLSLSDRYLVTLFDNNTLSRLNVTGGTASLDSSRSTLEITLGAGVTVDSFRAAGSRSFTIIDAGNGQLNGTFSAANFTNAGFASTEWSVTYDNTAGNATLNFTPVPEPQVTLGIASGVALFGGLCWRRRNSRALSAIR